MIKPYLYGQTVVCIASGPSLTKEDCETVRKAGLYTIVTNNSFLLAPWANIVFGFDAAWWGIYHKQVKTQCNCIMASCSGTAKKFGVENALNNSWFHNFQNSGACAIGLAVSCGAKKVILIGYDCKKTDGKTHWHGDHVEGLSNAQSIKSWVYKFNCVALFANQKGVDVINASRDTSLECFRREKLEDIL
jgi:hypothetical protein